MWLLHCTCLFGCSLVAVFRTFCAAFFVNRARDVVCCVVCVVPPPTTQHVVTSKCVYYNPRECPPATCNRTVEECGAPLEGKRWHCYALWTNKTGSVVMLMRGCWIDVEKCYDQTSCVSNDMPMSRTDGSFCCCDGDLCNAKVYESPVRSSPQPTTLTPGVCVCGKIL